jgi:hypothetical protein
MDSLPVLDSKRIECDNNGVVYIKPRPTLTYVVGGLMALFALGYLVLGNIVGMIISIAAVAFIIIQLRSLIKKSSLKFDPKTRSLSLGLDSNSTTISFDDIDGFGLASQQENASFTKEGILAILKDKRTIFIGDITEPNEEKWEEKVSNMIDYLYDITGIEEDDNDSD